MEPVEIILSALVSGARARMAGRANARLRTNYRKLATLVHPHLEHIPAEMDVREPRTVFSCYQRDPSQLGDSLREAIVARALDQNPDVIRVANRVLGNLAVPPVILAFRPPGDPGTDPPPPPPEEDEVAAE